MTIILILAILFINLTLVFIIKSEVTSVIAILTANLIFTVLIYLGISDPVKSKELVIAIIIFSIISLFLNSNQVQIQKTSSEKIKKGAYCFAILLVICGASSFIVFDRIKENLVLREDQILHEVVMGKPSTENKPEALVQSKIQYLANYNLRESSLFNKFSEFLILIIMTIVILFLSIKSSNQNRE